MEITFKKIGIVIGIGIVIMLLLNFGLSFWPKEKSGLSSPTPIPQDTQNQFQNQNNNNGTSPTQIPIAAAPTSNPDSGTVYYQNKTGNASPLEVVSISPSNHAKNFPLDGKITITFNKTVSSTDFLFAITPSIDYNIVAIKNTAVIVPVNPLDANTGYAFAVTIPGISVTAYDLTTIIDPSKPASDQVQEITSFTNKYLYPDLYLSNYTPYSGGDFSVSSYASSSEPGTYYFDVTLSDTQGKANFISWMKGLGLTDDQINQLSISYLSNGVAQ